MTFCLQNYLILALLGLIVQYTFFPKPQEQLPFTVSRISVVGAAGQGTTIGGYRELDLAVFVKGTMFDTNCNP